MVLEIITTVANKDPTEVPTMTFFTETEGSALMMAYNMVTPFVAHVARRRHKNTHTGNCVLRQPAWVLV